MRLRTLGEETGRPKRAYRGTELRGGWREGVASDLSLTPSLLSHLFLPGYVQLRGGGKGKVGQVGGLT